VVKMGRTPLDVHGIAIGVGIGIGVGVNLAAY
jgi:hypothetical protein